MRSIRIGRTQREAANGEIETKKRPSSKGLVLTVAVAIVTVGAALLLAIIHKTVQPTSAIQAFRISQASQLPKTGEIETKTTVESDKQVLVLARYDAKKLDNAQVKFFKADGKQAFDTGLFQLSNQGTFSVSINPKVLQLGDYTVKLIDKSGKTVVHGSLKVVGKVGEKKQ